MKKTLIALFFLYFMIGFEGNAQNQDSIAFVHAFKFYKSLIGSKLPDKFYKVLGVNKLDTIVNVKSAAKYQFFFADNEKSFYTFSFNNTNIELVNFEKNIYTCFGIKNIKSQNGVGGCSQKQVMQFVASGSKPDSLKTLLEYMIGPIPIYVDPWESIKSKLTIEKKVSIQSGNTKFIKQGDKWINNNKYYSLKEALEILKIHEKTSKKILKMNL